MVMKNLDVLSLGRMRNFSHGWIARLGAICVGATFLFLASHESKAQSLTQLQFVHVLIQISGSADQLPANASTADYIQWAESQGVSPKGGWRPDAVLNGDVVAETLVQLLKLNPKKFGGDFKKNLLREGIVVPDGDELSRGQVLAMLDSFEAQPRLIDAKMTVSPVKGGRPAGKIPPGFLNPKNPHYGTPVDELPGAQGISNAQDRGNKR